MKKIVFLIFIICCLTFNIITTCSNKSNNKIITEENDTVLEIDIPDLDEIEDTTYFLPIDMKYDSVFYRSKEKFVHYKFTDKQLNELKYILQKNSWNVYENNDSSPSFDDLECYGLVYQNIIVAYFNRFGSKMLIRINNIYDGSISEYYFVPIETYTDIEKFILE